MHTQMVRGTLGLDGHQSCCDVQNLCAHARLMAPAARISAALHDVVPADQ